MEGAVGAAMTRPEKPTRRGLTCTAVEQWSGRGPGADSIVSGVAVDALGDVFTAHRDGRTWAQRSISELIDVPVIQRWGPEGNLVNSFGAGLFRHPHGICVDPQGNIWVTDVAHHQVFCLASTGEVLLVLGTSGEAGCDETHFNLPTDIAVTQGGRIFVSDGYGNARVVEFAADGSYRSSWGSEGVRDGEFRLPHAILVDTDETLVVVDRSNGRLQRFTLEGEHLQTLDHGGIDDPFGVAAMDASLVVVDCGFPGAERGSLVVLDKATGCGGQFAEHGSVSGLKCPHAVAVYGTTVYVADAIGGLRVFDLDVGS